MNKTISTSQYRLRDLESKFKQAVQTNTHRLCCVQEHYLHLKVCKIKVHRIAVFPQCALSCLSIREAAGLSPSLDRKTLPRCGGYFKLAESFLCVMHHWHYECVVTILKSVLNSHLRGYYYVVGRYHFEKMHF